MMRMANGFTNAGLNNLANEAGINGGGSIMASKINASY